MNQEPPLVSVVLPCWNQGRYLHDSIGSLRAQTLTSWEAIVVNDGSPDDTARIASALARDDSRVRYVEQENAGVSAARNTGVSEVRGRYVQFLDPDDRLDRRKLEVQVRHLETRPDIGILYGDARYFTTENPAARESGPKDYTPGKPWSVDGQPWVGRSWERPGPFLSKLARLNPMPTPCALFRREVLESIGPFTRSLRVLEDWEYWVRCAASGVRFQYLDAPDTWALIRMHPQSLTRDPRRMRESTFAFRLAVAHLFTTRNDQIYNARKAMRVADGDWRARARALTRVYAAHSHPLARLYAFGGFLFAPSSPIGRLMPWRAQQAIEDLLGQ